MKVREMWDNEPESKTIKKLNRDRKRQALSYELKMLFNRQFAIYKQLHGAGEVIPPEDAHIAIANKENFIWISTSLHINIPSVFIIRYSEENAKIAELFDKINRRVDKLKLLLTQTGSVEKLS